MSSEQPKASQAGGSHYQDVPEHLMHWNVVAAMGWDYYIGTATKYLWRLGKKDDPVLELDKAISYLMKKKELILAERAAAKTDETIERITSGLKYERPVAPSWINEKT